jgi:ubiquinol-cytochrome c reductase cytochrome b subunit
MWETIANLLEYLYQGNYNCIDCTLVQESFFAGPIISFLHSTVANAGKKGSKYSKPRAVSPEKQAMQLSDEQKEILVGTLLGDASIERSKPTHNGRLQFLQTFPAHAEYLTVLYVQFINLAKSAPKVVIRKADKRTGKVYSQIQWKSPTYTCFNMYHDMFYVNGKKVVPANIAELLTPRALAYWIMDDGGKDSYGATLLHTRSFTLAEVQLLQTALMDNFSLRTRLIEKSAGQWVIVIPIKQVRSLKDIVSIYMCRSMLYKI